MSLVENKSVSAFIDPAIAVLVLSNLGALLAAIHYEWNVFELIFLFWLETAIIGFFSIIKLIHTAKLLALFFAPFFLLHFGGFMYGHLIFVVSFFGGDTFFNPTIPLLINHIELVLYPTLGLFVSHLFSFVHNYLGKREYEKQNFMHYFMYPYPRIIVMHLTIIFGGILIQFLGPIYGLILLTVLKVTADIKTHLLAHQLKESKMSLAIDALSNKLTRQKKSL